MLVFHIVGVFPETIKSYLDSSILKKAQDKKLIKVNYYSVFDFVDKKERIDDEPFGGGPGMVLKAEPFIKAIRNAVGRKRNIEYYFFSPTGELFNKDIAKKIAKDTHKKTKHIVLISGRYEGVDHRVAEVFNAKPLSVGNFVLSGGELAAALVVDACARFVKGVLGDKNSIEENRIASAKVYTKPREIIVSGKKYKVPDVLFSGDHKKINEWKKKNSSLT